MEIIENDIPEVSDVNTQTETFRRERGSRRTALHEDYIELIADLIEENGEARTVDIASRLGVAQPTVTKVIIRLKKEGLVNSEPYRSIHLTETGQSLARKTNRSDNRPSLSGRAG